ncbi:SDR family NAD(P)-dependent oxidoreductase [Hydrocarboniphaga sp.]|uniref:SDR family NAD(P)-dependent oxidoreductase n=1 Tax=Hydrocarboniphaga sp. TaxID=2033016 RepID=UPI003D0AB0DF
MADLNGKVAVVTGAASGIGRALALALARRSCVLELADIDELGLRATADACRALGSRVDTRVVDVSQREAVHTWAREVGERHAVNLVFNNAGIALGGGVEEIVYDDIERIMSVNFWGVVHGTMAFLPLLRRSGDGHLVNVSSIYGCLAMPGQSAYNASKFAVRGFTESLRMELDIKGDNVTASTVSPGGIRTNIAASAVIRSGSLIPDGDLARRQFSARLITDPERAAAIILDGVRKRRRRILVGRDAFWFDVLVRLLPAAYQRLVGNIVKRRFERARAERLTAQPPG